MKDGKQLIQEQITPGKQPECETEIDGEFEFLHPKTTCDLTACEHHFICKTWRGAQQGAILPIPQSVPQTVPLEVYSLSDMENFSKLPFADQDYSANYQVVGQGQAKATCGTFWTKICLEPHPAKELSEKINYQKDLNGQCQKDGAYIHRVKMSCHRPLCPTCWPSWVKRQIAKAEKRFRTLENTLTKEEKQQMKRCHVGVSIPKNLHELPKKEMQRIVLRYLKQLGIEGGCIVYHSARQKTKIRGNWTPENTYYWPHFHIYADLKNGWINGKKVDKISKKTGLIIRNFGERPLQKNMFYQLSHAGVPPNSGHVLTWFGSMNYRKLHVEKYEAKYKTCPWGHKLDHYGVHLHALETKLPEKEGYSAILPREGWIYLPHKIKSTYEDLMDPGGGYE